MKLMKMITARSPQQNQRGDLMAFYGCYFSFDGIPCTDYGLMMYDFGIKSDSSNDISVSMEIVEDRIARRYSPLHYGTITNKPLEFTMTFGADTDSIDKNVFLDRWDIDAIASWLTAQDEYKWLEITQPDMELFRYKCFITDLKHVDVGGLPWGFTCTVRCDSPFAYRFPEVFELYVNGNASIEILNKSSYRGFYKPKIDLSLVRGGTFSIQNITDGSRTMQFTALPTSVTNLSIDNENEIITCNAISNPYQYFNFNFFRLCRGINHLVLNGNGTIKITCEFPINIGG